jgi:hypothetical protein
MTDREQADLERAIAAAAAYLDEHLGQHEVCAIHHVVEPFVKGRSIQCFECKHVYFGEHSLMEEWKHHINERAQETVISPAVVKVLTIDDIPFCPLCLHDW